MEPAFFPDFKEKNGAETVYKQDDDNDKGSAKLPSRMKIVPRLLPKPGKTDDGEPLGVGLGRVDEEWDDQDGVSPGLGEPNSPSVKQFRFAPLHGPLLPGKPDKAFKLSSPMLSALEFLPTEHAPKSGTEFEDSDAVRLGDSKTGWFPEEADPQASESRTLRMRKQKQSWQWGQNQTNMEEPPFLIDAPRMDQVYPVEGGLGPVVFLAAESESWTFSELKFLRELEQQKSLYMFSAEATGGTTTAIYLVRFFFEKNPQSPTKIIFQPNSTEVFDFGANLNESFPTGARAPEDVAKSISTALASNKKLLSQVAQAIGKEYQAERGAPTPPAEKEPKPEKAPKQTKEQKRLELIKRAQDLLKK